MFRGQTRRLHPGNDLRPTTYDRDYARELSWRFMPRREARCARRRRNVMPATITCRTADLVLGCEMIRHWMCGRSVKPWLWSTPEQVLDDRRNKDCGVFQSRSPRESDLAARRSSPPRTCNCHSQEVGVVIGDSLEPALPVGRHRG
jgi:hypothetical protein